MLIGSSSVERGHPLAPAARGRRPRRGRRGRPSRPRRCTRRRSAPGTRRAPARPWRGSPSSCARPALTSSRMPGLVDDVGQLVAAVGGVDVDQDRRRSSPWRTAGAPTRRQFGDQMPTRSPFATPVREQAPRERVDVGVQLGVGPAAAGRRRRPAPRGRGTGPRSAPGCRRSCPPAGGRWTCRSCTTGALASRVPPLGPPGCRPHPCQRAPGRQGTGPAPITVGRVASPSSRRAAPVRSLADDVRTRSDDHLRALVRRRPDLARPAPSDLTSLAARAGTRASVQRALDGLDRGPPAGPRGLRRLPATPSTWRRPRRCWGRPARAMDPLRRHPVDGGPALARVRRAARGARRRRGARSAPGRARAVVRRAARVRPGQPRHRRGDRRAGGAGTTGGAGHPRPPDLGPAGRRPRDGGTDRDGGRLAARAPADQPALGRPRRGAARGGPAAARRPAAPPPRPRAATAGAHHAHRPTRSTTPPAGRPPTCSAWSTRSPPTGDPVRRACCAPVASPSATCGGWPPALDVEPDHAAFVAEIAYIAGLVADDGSLEPVWAPTPAYDEWQQRPSADRWAVLASAWLVSGRAPHLVGQTPSGGSGTVNALSSDVLWPPTRQLRGDVLRELADLPGGRRPDPGGPVRAHPVAPPAAPRRDRRRGRGRRPARGRVARRQRPRRAQRCRAGAGGPRPRGARGRACRRDGDGLPPALAGRARAAAGGPDRRRPRAARGQPGAVHAARRRRRVPRRRHRLPLLRREPAPGPGRRLVVRADPDRAAGRQPHAGPAAAGVPRRRRGPSPRPDPRRARSPRTSAATTRRCSTACWPTAACPRCSCVASPRPSWCRPCRRRRCWTCCGTTVSRRLRSRRTAA